MTYYIGSHLSEGEEILMRPKIHWYFFAPSVFIFIVALIFIPYGSLWEILSWSYQYGFGAIWDNFAHIIKNYWKALSLFSLALYSLYRIMDRIIAIMAIEMAITTDRIVVKMGIFTTDTIEMNISKMESINIEQSMTGTMLDFGYVYFNGVGDETITFPMVHHPASIRREALNASKKASSGSGK